MKRTIGIFAHVDAGKTTLSEQILYHGKTIRNKGRVDHKNTYLDNHDIEKARGITVFSDIGAFTYGEKEFYIVDTPGHIDFSPEMERAVAVLDYAILVINAAEGVQGHSESIWEILNKYKTPTVIFINKMDREGVILEEILQEIKEKLSDNIVYFNNNESLEQINDETIEAVSECDEELLFTYLEEGYEKKLWSKAIKSLTKKRALFPVFSGIALLDEGIKEFLDLFTEIVEVNYIDESELKGRVFKIKYDDKGNRLTFVKLLSGRLEPKGIISYYSNGEFKEEKINAIRAYNGNKFEVVEEARGGDIVALLGLSSMEAGDGIGIESIDSYNMVPTLKSKVIFDNKLNPKDVLECFKILEAEEKSLKVTWNEALKEINISIMGAVQLEVLKEILSSRFNLDISFDKPSILYKETIVGEIMGCGHFEPLGHYAEVILKLEEGERNKGIEFVNKCHADHLTIGQQNLIKTHIFEKEHNGILTGSPITDIKITLLTGRAHNKHTSGGDFREATKRAIRQGLESVQNRLLEPYYRFKIEVNIENIGRVLSDIQKMNGEFKEPITKGNRVLIIGRGPVSTFMSYGLEFQSFTKGKGTLNFNFDGYDYCHNEEEIIKQFNYNRNADIEYTSTSIFCSKGQSYLVEGENAKEVMHCLAK